MKIATIADLLGVLSDALLEGGSSVRRRSIRGYSTDTRSLKKGEVFIALVGERFDGHTFLEVAAERGAAAALVTRAWLDHNPKRPDGLPLITVPDTLVAYGEIATAHRSGFSYPVIAIAGSNGKTTTKELVADVLGERYMVVRTEGNLNNLIGTPATMLRMTDEHTAAVIEIGTNCPGEIERLCRILRPTHGLITNVGREHLELLGSVEGVAKEEGALFEYLAETGGVAFVNLDDRHIARMAKRLPNAITYGRSARAQVRGTIGPLDEIGAPSIEIVDARKEEAKPIRAQLKTPGLHTATNAMAAAAVGLALKVAPTKIRRVLEAFEPRAYRAGYARLGATRAANGARVLNDTYNANPDSVVAALATLEAMKPERGGQRIAVLADMKELGASSAEEHARIGRELAGSKRIGSALFFGDEMRHAYQALAGAGTKSPAPLFFQEKRALIEALKGMLTPADIVLVKGSRGMTMEEVVGGLIESDNRDSNS